MKHEIVEKNIGLMIVLIVIAKQTIEVVEVSTSGAENDDVEYIVLELGLVTGHRCSRAMKARLAV